MEGEEVQNKNLRIAELDEKLTEKEKLDIEKELTKLQENVIKEDTPLFSGNPVDEEAKQSILEALEFIKKQAKLINRKYTPKRYRKD